VEEVADLSAFHWLRQRRDLDDLPVGHPFGHTQGTLGEEQSFKGLSLIASP